MQFLKNKICLVTGASGIIGFELCKKMIISGATLLALDKNQKKLEELDDFARSHGSKIVIINCDIKKFDEIDSVGAEIFSRFGKLDILISLAAINSELMPLTHFTPKSWQRIIDVNFTANWRLIRSLDLLLKKSEKSLAIFASCAETTDNKAFYGPYGISKMALASMVETYRLESEGTNLHIELISPEKTKSPISQAIWPGLTDADFTKAEFSANKFMASIEKHYS